MARSLNLCQFIGNLGKDPEVRYSAEGKAIANMSVAVADGYRDKQTGEQVDQTEWVKCVAFGQLAEICQQYLHKGSKVYVAGRMKTRKWQNQEGKDQYSTEIVLDNMQMLDSKPDSQPAAARTPPPPIAEPAGFDDLPEDDIPF